MIGGIIVDWNFAAAGGRSSGTLLASGYIAGGALAGIIIAITAGVLTDFDTTMMKSAEAYNLYMRALAPTGCRGCHMRD